MSLSDDDDILIVLETSKVDRGRSVSVRRETGIVSKIIFYSYSAELQTHLQGVEIVVYKQGNTKPLA